MTIGKKLTVCFAGMAALLLVLSYSSLSSLSSMKERFDTAVEKTAKKIMIADVANEVESEMLAWQRGMVLYSYAKDSAKVEAAKRRFHENAAIALKAMDEIRPLLVDDEGRQLVDQTKTGLQEWVTLFGEVERLCAAGQNDAAVKLAAEKIVPLNDALGKQAARLTELQKARLDTDRADAEAQNARNRWLAFVLIGLALAVGGGVLFLIRQISAVLRQIAGEMSEGAEQVASAAAQVSTSSQALAQGASEQAASLEETSSSSEEINSMTRKNAENSQSAAQLMVEAANLVDGANRKLELMVSSMKDINASSDKISKIIRVIDEIAFQTNILALNAAVEAARAGEAGMGFAVVADEVRNLAQRCAQAAKDTAALIEESISKSTEGSTRLNEVGEAIHSVTESASKVKTLVDEVNLGSQEQARGIEQVAKAIAQMEQVTQKTAANAEESASAGEELSAQSDTLNTMVERLTALVGGGESGRPGGARRKRPMARGPVKDSRHTDGASLAALGKAVGRGPAPAKAERERFPMEEEFKDF